MAQIESTITDKITNNSNQKIKAVYNKQEQLITIKDFEDRDQILENITAAQLTDYIASLQLVADKAAVEFA